MTSTHAPTPAAILVGPSRILTLWVVLAFAATTALSAWYLPLWATAGIVLASAVSAASALRLHARRSHPQAVVALRCHSDTIEIRVKSGHWIIGAILPGALISDMLTVVRIRDKDVAARVRYLVLMPDNVHQEDYRRLRVILRWLYNEETGDNL